jgi:hypothetical protein
VEIRRKFSFGKPEEITQATKNRWEGNVNLVFKGTGLESRDWIHLAPDRIY